MKKILITVIWFGSKTQLDYFENIITILLALWSYLMFYIQASNYSGSHWLVLTYHLLTSSVIYYWTDGKQHGIYLINKYTHALIVNQFLSPGQTIATCQAQRNISQHCWSQHVACVWPPCCDMLRGVGCCWLKFENGQNWPNNTQHVATDRNTVAKRTQHVAPNNVEICCVDMLRSFGRGFSRTLQLSLSRLSPATFEQLLGVWSNFLRFQ